MKNTNTTTNASAATTAQEIVHSTNLGEKQYMRGDGTFRDEIAQTEDVHAEGTREEVLAHLAEMMALAEADEREALEWESRGSSFARGSAAVRMVQYEINRVEAYAAKFLAAKAEGMDDDDAHTAAAN